MFHIHQTIRSGGDEQEIVKTVQKLLEDGYKVNTMDENGWTPLMLAAKYGYIGVVITLFHHGARIDAGQKSAIHMAKNPGMIKLLTEKSAERMPRDDVGKSVEESRGGKCCCIS